MQASGRFTLTANVSGHAALSMIVYSTVSWFNDDVGIVDI